jgi:hypothetical protein
MRSETEIRERLETLRAYWKAGWFQDDSHASFAENELLWVLGEVDG